jgi:predicted GNAT family acetyltransferase
MSDDRDQSVGAGADVGASARLDVTVADVPERRRYEARVPGVADAAAAHYRLRDGTIVFTHTEVPPALEGHGVGSALARFALDDARRRGLAVVPRCPFVAAFIRRHPEYRDLVARGGAA